MRSYRTQGLTTPNAISYSSKPTPAIPTVAHNTLLLTKNKYVKKPIKILIMLLGHTTTYRPILDEVISQSSQP